MPLSPDLIEQLAEKKMLGTITAEEQQQLSEWLQQLKAGDQLIWESQDANEEELKIRLWNRIQESTQMQIPVVRVRRIGWMKYAAAAILIIGMGAYLWNYTQKEKPSVAETDPHPVKNDIAPGINAPVLTLADGRQISLDSSRGGVLTKQGSAEVQKSAGGQIIYSSQLPAKELIYNSLTVPRGSQVVTLTLADGSRVWLNAESSVRYPVVFVGNERRVEIEGEAYFEVAKDKTKPFIVSIAYPPLEGVARSAGGGPSPAGGGGLEIEVLGTQFNVNAYKDEVGIKTSLIEGSVKIIDSRLPTADSRILKPGEAYLNEKVITTDIEQDIAWKNGRFLFNGATIETILRQAARWYDVTIEYKGKLPQVNYMGDVSRQENISELLKILEQTGTILFTIEGKKVIVTP